MIFLPSSQAYNITVYNANYLESPYVDIALSSSFSSEIGATIEIKDNNNSNYTLTITGSNNGVLSSTTFNTSVTNNAPIFSLAECLKKNTNMFYDVKVSGNLNDGFTVRAYFDNNTAYTFTVTSGLSISGYTTGNYSPMVKEVMHFHTEDSGDFEMEKYTKAKSVYFNITSPFTNSIDHKPIQFDIYSYSHYSDIDSISHTKYGSDYGSYVVIPSTIGEFEKIDNYNGYVVNGETLTKGKFLTTKTERDYMYGEKIALSVLSTNGQIYHSLRIKCYTPSGILITTKSPTLTIDNTYRIDYIIDPNISNIEAQYGKVVGYMEVDVVGRDSVTPISNVVRYNVVPKCATPRTLFFLNELGGIDSYTFRGSIEEKIDIDDNEAYTIKYAKQNNIKTMSAVAYKSMENMVTVNTGKISHAEGKWLKCLAATKYCFIEDPNETNTFYNVIIDDVDIDIDSSETYCECSVTYYIGDKTTI